jgi:hypothetical protein
MIDQSRRGILKLFGVTAAAGAAAAVPLAAPAVFEHKEVALGYTVDLKVPEGMTYQWKRVFITAEEPDMDNILQMVAAGWKPVPAARHRESFPEHVGAYWIEIGGVVLMEKPTVDIPRPRPHPLPWEDLGDIDV